MAAKKAAVRKTFIRKGDVSAKELMEQGERIRQLVQTLDVAAMQMDAFGVESVQVDGLTKIEVATEALTAYVANAQQAIERVCLTKRK